MNAFAFSFHGASLRALASGALFWPEQTLLVVSDLHFGKAARLSAVGGAPLPPYDTRDTLMRLEADLEATGSKQVVCLGDSFDAPGLDAALPEAEQLWIARLQAGRRWLWIEGNHDPGLVALGGAHLAELRLGPLVFRHIAEAGETGEVSGHYHPKARIAARGRALSRPCFLLDEARLILPAYGTYTGGLFSHAAPLRGLMSETAQAILTGPRPVAVPMPR
ncbi:ligase-associated DNA damage response endonuclease PdeM [Aestuariicoccus sp. MJ-SS9]|uniref:ligase-associated DNA damage response endonuclease PdeM n=1 Tax=Aestuariicoccus sp. MJ-SS9 TaxID=3079855 RepID=UPI00291116D3|nr:ligase-associated DNA damage response endonuclease PdeM [Aestuariicoccus sp. MJ-SS9]MDU8910410.1 ligase-associated DNA damage response endonuclease PdeM [Aestuariicoccus sp. MJ-SS9]